MNEKKRRKLRSAIERLEDASRIVDSVYDEEYDCVMNYPENLQNTERFEKMEDDLESIRDAIDQINQASSQIQEIVVA